MSASHFHETFIAYWLFRFLSPVTACHTNYKFSISYLISHPFLNVSFIPKCILLTFVSSPASNIVSCTEHEANKHVSMIMQMKQGLDSKMCTVERLRVQAGVRLPGPESWLYLVFAVWLWVESTALLSQFPHLIKLRWHLQHLLHRVVMNIKWIHIYKGLRAVHGTQKTCKCW